MRTGIRNVPAEATCRIKAALSSSSTHFDFTVAGESTIRKYLASEMPLFIFPGMLSPSLTSSLSYQTGMACAARSETSRSTKTLSLLACEIKIFPELFPITHLQFLCFSRLKLNRKKSNLYSLYLALGTYTRYPFNITFSGLHSNTFSVSSDGSKNVQKFAPKIKS